MNINSAILSKKYKEWLLSNQDHGYWYERMKAISSILYYIDHGEKKFYPVESRGHLIKKLRSVYKHENDFLHDIDQWEFMSIEQLNSTYERVVCKYSQAIEMWKSR